MLKLKSRLNAPPDGFRYRDHNTGWKNWEQAPNTVWDFNGLVQAVIIQRKANRARFPILSLDPTAVANEIDFQNAHRLKRMPGSESYFYEEGEAVMPPKPHPHSALTAPVAAVVGGLRKFATAAATLMDWEKSGDAPASPELSSSRALTCSKCDQNDSGDWTRHFATPIAEMIRKQMARTSELKLSTPLDNKLGTCKACGCVLKTKVHFPIKHILAHQDATTKAELDPQCWILSESNTAGVQ